MERIQLTQDTIERLHLGDIDDFDVEDLVLLRALQSYEENEFAPPSEEDLAKILTWYEDITTGQAVLNMVLKGEIYVMYDPEQDDISFRLAPNGQDIAREMGLDVPELPSLD